jgi:hypothetical protein
MHSLCDWLVLCQVIVPPGLGVADHRWSAGIGRYRTWAATVGSAPSRCKRTIWPPGAS